MHALCKHFKRSNILNLVDIFYLQTVNLYYNMFHGKLPNFFLGRNFITISDNPKKKTRHKDIFYHIYHRLESTTKTLRYQLISIINHLEPIILDKVKTHSFCGISNYYKTFLISNYPQICTIPNCYVCLKTWLRILNCPYFSYFYVNFILVRSICNPNIPCNSVYSASHLLALSLLTKLVYFFY